ncbi:hypothetical protein CVD25_05305 [Bacillus canaveralius]|uniref:ABC transporter periplasmic binding protein yphF n=1 Tax=Bacillus canaveralius TaxID=1403243 RepID=A0A2N5GRR0_9BACI|nr:MULTISPECIES: hypothetical protein [Bacillus]PLR82643.1 hypothetical protein CVD23_15655 [Bacillus sp. V33-4]PLR86132.1 hypothetical protein CU635_03595 [Bacillus canaveralius]PLS00252.1 hypothetical protein CVD25_05305 [Bacillus canaveralius]RSK51984.1 hypothetical protein EJA13_12460 [Bacillus canaveralius]
MKKALIVFLVAIITAMLTGCMYPNERLAENQIPYKDQADAVQSAVDQFREASGGLLPIKTKEAETPIYEKYPIDFARIVPTYMAELPGNSFENGGVFQYVLVDVETDPKVKLFDLRIAETIRDIKMRIYSNGYPPYKEQIADGIFTLDFKKLGYKEDPVVISPYTQQNLPFIVTGEGVVLVDYRSDLYQALKAKESNYEPGEDIRNILVEDSYFVPAYSHPYTIEPESDEPIFLVK